MLWPRRTTAKTEDRSRHIGIDLTASRVRAVGVNGERVRQLVLDDPAEDVLLFLSCAGRVPDAGRAGYAICRKLPHLTYSNFLASLAQPRTGRQILTPEAAIDIVFAKLQGPLAAEGAAASLAMPIYLAPNQISRVVAAATRARIQFKGTAAAPLALVADLADRVLLGVPPVQNPTPAEWVVPLRAAAVGGGPGSVMVVDADEFALSAAAIAVDRNTVKLLASNCWPRASLKAWKDMLLDAVADRCVRLCRRDPRDSADAEQDLYEQLDSALDRARAGQRIGLTVRTATWYQDIAIQPEEFETSCLALARAGSESLRELASSLPVPPRLIWLTDAAGRLPGLARTIHENSPAGTCVEVLPAGAIALAAARLVPRWLSGELARTHLDTMIPLGEFSSQPAAEKAKRGAGNRE